VATTEHPASATVGRRWTSDHRAAAFAVYFRTGSRRKARKETGVPERTLSAWLRDERYAEERRAVQAGLLQSVQQDAARRGIEVAEATREAVLVCRKALRGNPDGKTASSLLTALSRCRETEDRIQRLDEGKATEIAGVVLAPEDQEAFRLWYEDYRSRRGDSAQDIDRRWRECILEGVREALQAGGNGDLLRAILEAIGRASDGTLTYGLRRDVDLARQFHAAVTKALAVAEQDAIKAAAAGAVCVPQVFAAETIS
jgi:hypothetical protein